MTPRSTGNATTRFPNFGRLSVVLRAVVLLTVSIAWCLEARAESGVVMSRPGKGVGLKMDVDTRWVDGPGYRPVHLDFTPTVPVTADRTLTVELLCGRDWRNRNDGVRVVRDIEIPAGSKGVHVTVSVPQLVAWQELAVNVLEDGTVLRSLSQSWTPLNNRPDVLDETLPSIIFVGDTAPDSGSLAAVLPDDTSYRDSSMGLGMPLGGGPTMPPGMGMPPVPGPPAVGPSPSGTPARPQLPTTSTQPLGRLPTRWIDYTSADVVCLSMDQLVTLARQRSAAFRAIRAWTAAGGNLWVYGLGDDWQRLPELEKLLDMPPGSVVTGDGTAEEGSTADPATAGAWHRPGKADYTQAIEKMVRFGGDGFGEWPEETADDWGGMEVPADPFVTPDGSRVTDDPEAPYFETPEDAAIFYVRNDSDRPEQAMFATRDLQMGQVVALAPEDPFAENKAQWRWLLGEVGPDRWSWRQRHGLSTQDANPDFWKFLIPGVGLPPVNGFRVVITLFVLVIGPLNFYLLRRRKRLNLLVVTVPCIAGVITLSLLLYAVLADGLGTRVRVRSYTEIDQRHGTTTCWSRLSYYAGMAPRGGLVFPDDVAVLPLEFDPWETAASRGRAREVSWEDEQHLRNGWIEARTATQYVTIRSRATEARLEFALAGDSSETLAVTNRLGTPVEMLLVRTPEGDYHGGTALDDGDTVTLKQVDPAALLRRLRAAVVEHRPALPDSGANSPGEPFGPRRGYRGRRWYDQGIAPEQQTGRLESEITVLGKSYDQLLEPGSYVAVVTHSPEVVLGARGAAEEESFHVIRGRW